MDEEAGRLEHERLECERREHERRVTEQGNPAHPEGEAGSEMLDRMNRSHAGVTNWALDFLGLGASTRALDVGCGGGATMRRLAMRAGLVDADGHPLAAASGKAALAAGAPAAEEPAVAPAGHVSGIDYSEVSCEKSRAFNAEAIEAGVMDVVQASVDALPFADGAFDVVTTVESFYFWPHPEADVREVARVLRPGGRFLLVADVYRRDDLSQEVLGNIAEYGLTVLTPDGYRELFSAAGFSRCDVHLKDGTTWICAEGVR